MIHPLLDTVYTKTFFRDRFFFSIFSFGVMAHGVLWILLFLGFDTLVTSDTQYITLHYRVLFGTDFVAQWFSIFFIPFVGLLVGCVNYTLARTLYNIEHRLAYALEWAALAVQGILIFALYLLLQINLY